MSDPELRIWREELPVDDQWHTLTTGRIVSWGCRQPHTVEFWFWYDQTEPDVTREFRVYGTGQEIHPEGDDRATFEHRATLLVPHSPLVWHVIERISRDA